MEFWKMNGAGNDFIIIQKLKGGPRHLGASGHRDQKQGHIKTPAQHDAMRAHKTTFSLTY